MEPSTFLVNGEWRTSAKTRHVINPYRNRPVGEVYQASSRDIDDAIAAAAEAFQRTRFLHSYERSEILIRISRSLDERREEFARLITEETGKPITFSRAEVERSIFVFNTAAEEAGRMEGTVLPLDLASHSKGRFGIVRRFPVGPIAAITPFNFPLNLVAHKVAPALATGCTVVLKPSSNAPRTALLLAELVTSAGSVHGAINVVPCASDEAMQLVMDERIGLISFTGSPAVGWSLKSKAGKKKVVLELGGNAGVIVDRDANLDFAVPRIVQGSYGNAGQSCIAVQRIYVHEDLFDRFSELFLQATKAVVAGDPMAERTVVGPMIDEEAAAKVQVWVQEALDAGARLLCGGGRIGAMFEPTILVDVSPEMKVSCEEVFAPVVTLDRFSVMDDAVRKVNDSSFGLQAGLFSNNLEHVFRAFRELHVGGVVVNDYPTYRIDHMPYGGVKDSGFGREGVRYAMEEMTEMKLLAFNFP